MSLTGIFILNGDNYINFAVNLINDEDLKEFTINTFNTYLNSLNIIKDFIKKDENKNNLKSFFFSIISYYRIKKYGDCPYYTNICEKNHHHHDFSNYIVIDLLNKKSKFIETSNNYLDLKDILNLG